MKNKNNNQRKIIAFLVVLIIILFSLFYLKNSLPNLVLNNETYSANALNFTVNVPSNFSASDTGITLILKNDKGEISIIRNGTQYKDLKSYLSAQDLDLDYVVQGMTEIKINGSSAISRTEITGGKNLKLYYIYLLY